MTFMCGHCRSWDARRTKLRARGFPAVLRVALPDYLVVPLRSIPFTAEAIYFTEFPASSIRSTTLLSQTSQKLFLSFAPVKNSHSRNNKYTNVKIMFLRTFCNNSDMFRFIVIFFRELKNIKKAYVK